MKILFKKIDRYINTFDKKDKTYLFFKELKKQIESLTECRHTDISCSRANLEWVCQGCTDKKLIEGAE